MGTQSPVGTTDAGHRMRMGLGFAFLAAGFLGHVLAARAIGGSYIAYRDHMVGFVGLTIITGAIIAGLGWKFWRGRHDITLLALGILQASLGLYVYIERFSVHG